MSQWSFFQSTLIIALLSPLGLFLAASFFLLVIPAGKWPPKRRLLLGLLTLLFAFSCTDFCGKKMLAFLEALTPEARGGTSRPPGRRACARRRRGRRRADVSAFRFFAAASAESKRNLIVLRRREAPAFGHRVAVDGPLAAGVAASGKGASGNSLFEYRGQSARKRRSFEKAVFRRAFTPAGLSRDGPFSYGAGLALGEKIYA